MNRKTIHFSKLRFYMIALSVLLILAGFAGTISRGGFNFGIDFQAGLSQRLQIAPPGVEVIYEGEHSAVLMVNNGVVQVEIRDQDGVKTWDFSPDEYPTLQELATGISSIDGVSSAVVGEPDALTADIVTGLSLPYQLGEEKAYLNVKNTDTSNYAEIQNIRDALSEFSSVQVQVIGDPVNQEFLIRVQDDEESQKDKLESAVKEIMIEQFREHAIVLKQSDYVGPRFSEALASQSIVLVIVALVLILAYVWFRFKLGFAVASISALAHDIIFMLCFIGAFQIEINTATIAAVLTIIGYSLNDTIVIFDRIRENIDVLKDRPFKTVVDASITQSLSRTLITSLTTLLAVVALYVFGTGMIEDFALNLIVGVFIGTYSSVFIASPVLIGWVQQSKRKQAKHLGYAFDAERDTVLETSSPGTSSSGSVQEDGKLKEIEIPTAERKMKGKRSSKKKK